MDLTWIYKIPEALLFEYSCISKQCLVGIAIVACHQFSCKDNRWWEPCVPTLVLLDTIHIICGRAKLAPDNPRMCLVFSDASTVWGLIGPRRIFGDLGAYLAIKRFFLLGAICPLLVWLAHKAFTRQQLIGFIALLIVTSALGEMPSALEVSFLFGFVIYRHRRDSRQCHDYALSRSLDADLTLLYTCGTVGGHHGPLVGIQVGWMPLRGQLRRVLSLTIAPPPSHARGV